MNRRLALLIAGMIAVAPPAMATDAWGDLLTVREDRSEIAREDYALRHQPSGAVQRQRQRLGGEAGDLGHARARLDHDEREIARRHLKQRS